MGNKAFFNKTKEFSNHKDEIFCIQFNNSGSLLAQGSADKTVSILNMNTLELQNELKDHDFSITCIAFSRNNLLATGSYKTVILYDSQQKQLQKLNDHQGWISCLVFCEDGSKMISSCDNKKIIIYEVEVTNGKCQDVENRLKQILQISDNIGLVEHIVFIHNDQFVSACSHKSLKLWDCQHQLVKSIPHEGIISALLHSNKLSLLACGFKQGDILIYDKDFQIKFSFQNQSKLSILSLAFSDYSQYLIASYADSTIVVYNLINQAIVQTINNIYSNDIAFDSNNNYLAATTLTNQLILYSSKKFRGCA